MLQDQNVIIDRTKTTFGCIISLNQVDSNACARKLSIVENSNTQQSTSCIDPLKLSDDGSLLQSRRLTGDTSRKGEEWWKICKANESSSGSSSKTPDQSMITAESSNSASQSESNASNRQYLRIQHKPRIDQKVYIVPNKKTQYGHLISSHGELARDENMRPIIYRRPERGKKEAAPLWFHPFHAHSSDKS
ncbi:hypothetical protein ACHAWO_010761 [Cyclotella atomus]|uniref:Uncharacterized protein n=1 Tax=Cyclotella atomus TaxID=382360 RepID=A0ABD3NES8_9STRA